MSVNMDTVLQAKLMIFTALKHSDLTRVYYSKVGNTCFQRRTGGGGLWGSPPPPRNSEGPEKSCQTQPDC